MVIVMLESFIWLTQLLGWLPAWLSNGVAWWLGGSVAEWLAGDRPYSWLHYVRVLVDAIFVFAVACICVCMYLCVCINMHICIYILVNAFVCILN